VPYVKCVRCKIRVSDATARRDLVEEGSCPSCGRPMEPVADLAELVGYRSPSLQEPRTPKPVADRVADIVARREMESTVRLAAQRWLDEAGSFAETAAEAARELPPQ